MTTKNITEILKEIEQTEFENLSSIDVEKLTSAILNEVMFCTESVHNNEIVTKERMSLMSEILKDILELGIHEWCDTMSWSTFKALQIADRALRGF